MLGVLWVLAQVMPEETDNPWVWLSGALALAVGTLFWQLLASKDRESAARDKRAEEWKELAQTATSELSKTTESLKTLTDAVDRHGRETAAAIEKHGQAVMVLDGDVRKLAETLGTLDRRLERLEEPPGVRRGRGD